MKNKQTLLGPKKSEKMTPQCFSMLTKCSNTKPTRLTDAFKNNVLRKTIEATIMKIEQNLRNINRFTLCYIVMHCVFVLKFNTNLRKISLKCQIKTTPQMDV